MKYPKIQTLWKRDPNNDYCIMPGEYSQDSFEAIRRWHVTEKVDGTNIRVLWDGVGVAVGGRTDRAQTPQSLLDRLTTLFPAQKMERVFGASPVVLFGEGYGNKIQKCGHNYIPDGVDFILFDIYVDGWWLEPQNVDGVGEALETMTVPTIGVMETDEIVEYVKSRPKSAIANTEGFVTEGVVVRSKPQLFTRRGDRVMWKLKVKDYDQLDAEV